MSLPELPSKVKAAIVEALALDGLRHLVSLARCSRSCLEMAIPGIWGMVPLDSFLRCPIPLRRRLLYASKVRVIIGTIWTPGRLDGPATTRANLERIQFPRLRVLCDIRIVDDVQFELFRMICASCPRVRVVHVNVWRVGHSVLATVQPLPRLRALDIREATPFDAFSFDGPLSLHRLRKARLAWQTTAGDGRSQLLLGMTVDTLHALSRSRSLEEATMCLPHEIDSILMPERPYEASQYPPFHHLRSITLAPSNTAVIGSLRHLPALKQVDLLLQDHQISADTLAVVSSLTGLRELRLCRHESDGGIIQPAPFSGSDVADMIGGMKHLELLDVRLGQHHVQDGHEVLKSLARLNHSVEGVHLDFHVRVDLVEQETQSRSKLAVFVARSTSYGPTSEHKRRHLDQEVGLTLLLCVFPRIVVFDSEMDDYKWLLHEEVERMLQMSRPIERLVAQTSMLY